MLAPSPHIKCGPLRVQVHLKKHSYWFGSRCGVPQGNLLGSTIFPNWNKRWFCYSYFIVWIVIGIKQKYHLKIIPFIAAIPSLLITNFVFFCISRCFFFPLFSSWLSIFSSLFICRDNKLLILLNFLLMNIYRSF